MELMLLLLFCCIDLAFFEVSDEELMVMMGIFDDDLIINVYKFPTGQGGEVKVGP